MIIAKTFDPGRIRAIREYRGYSQAQTAQQIGTSQPTYNLIEQGKVQLKMDALLQLSRYFDIDIRCFFAYSVPLGEQLEYLGGIKKQGEVLEAKEEALNRAREEIAGLRRELEQKDALLHTKDDLLAVERYRLKKRENAINIILFAFVLFVFITLGQAVYQALH